MILRETKKIQEFSVKVGGWRKNYIATVTEKRLGHDPYTEVKLNGSKLTWPNNLVADYEPYKNKWTPHNTVLFKSLPEAIKNEIIVLTRNHLQFRA